MKSYYIYYMDILKYGFNWRVAKVHASNQKDAINKLAKYRDFIKSNCIITRELSDYTDIKIIDIEL